MDDMLTIGIKIGECFDALQETVNSISYDELTEFGQYLESLDATMPITNPTLYMQRSMDNITQAQRRLAILHRLKGEVIGE
jgi:hypothetical protein